jgi:hypothetical protein
MNEAMSGPTLKIPEKERSRFHSHVMAAPGWYMPLGIKRTLLSGTSIEKSGHAMLCVPPVQTEVIAS